MLRLRSTLFAIGVSLVAVWAGDANAGLQRWSVLYLDGNGNPTTFAKAKSAEAYAFDSRGYSIAIGCSPDGGYSLMVTAPKEKPPKFAKIDEVEPSIRVGQPGTDYFMGPVGAMHFDGKRYVGRIPASAVEPLQSKIRNGLFAFWELNSHTTIKLKTLGIERALREVDCK